MRRCFGAALLAVVTYCIGATPNPVVYMRMHTIAEKSGCFTGVASRPIVQISPTPNTNTGGASGALVVIQSELRLVG